MGQKFACTSTYLDPRILEFVESQVQSYKILVVSKMRCAACIKAKQLLREVASKTGVDIRVFEVDKYELQCTKGIMKYLCAQTGINTVPQIYINGRFVGGNDDIQRLHREGRLIPLVMQRMKPKPSIRSSFDGNGAYPCRSLYLSPLQTDVLPAPTFDIISAKKSNGFGHYESLGTEAENRRGSQFSSVPLNSSIIITKENKWDVPVRRRSLSSIPAFSSGWEENKWDVSTMKPKRLNRSRSASSIESQNKWREFGVISTVHNDFNKQPSSVSNYQLMKDEKMLASQGIPSTKHVMPSYQLREDDWLLNSNTTAVDSVDLVPNSSGSNEWYNISTII